MPVKRFVAADMRRALTMVREELGDDAMIMSTQRTKKGVELIASAEQDNAIDDTAVNQPLVEQPTGAIKASSKNPRLHHARMSPRIEPQINQAFLTTSSKKRGPVSGKTHEELANEIEQAREKMLLSKRQQSMTIGDWAEQNKDKATATVSPLYEEQQQTTASIKNKRVNTNNPSQPSDKQWENLLQKASEQQQAVTEKTDKEIRELQNEIMSMRQSFAQQLETMSLMQSQHFNEVKSHHELVPLAQTVKQRLQNMGLAQHCTDSILKSLKSIDNQSISVEGLWKESLARLSHRIRSCDTDVVKQGGVFAFWGPTGVGKTTTIAKLAARFVIEQGRRDIVLLSTDRFRIAAHDQLKSLGKILNVPVKIVEDLDKLPVYLNALSKKSLVLIDTPGMNRQDALFKEHMVAMRRCKQIHHSLVVSANSQYQMLQACYHSYRLLDIKSCVLTKLDECASLGDGISLLAQNSLPLSYITDGQNVPEDIDTIRPHQLVTKALALSKRYGLNMPKSEASTVPESV